MTKIRITIDITIGNGNGIGIESSFPLIDADTDLSRGTHDG